MQWGRWDEAAVWYGRAAHAGHAEAMFGLGWLLQHVNLGEVLRRRGELVEAETTAETWYRRAAEAGHAEAMTELGKEVVYRRGDLFEAATWYRRAAEAGEAGGMNNLGLLLEYRPGEHDEAETWFRRAAEAGHSEAMFNLGALFAAGMSPMRPRPGTGGRPRPATAGRSTACGGCSSAGVSPRRAYRRGESDEVETLAVTAMASPSAGTQVCRCSGRVGWARMEGTRPRAGSVRRVAVGRSSGWRGGGRGAPLAVMTNDQLPERSSATTARRRTSALQRRGRAEVAGVVIVAGPPVPTARRRAPAPRATVPGPYRPTPWSTTLVAVPPPHRDDRDRRPGTGRYRPGGRHAALPGLAAGSLQPWGHYRTRTVRDRGTATVVLRPRRARCAACRATYVLRPALAAPRRADTTFGIGAALQAGVAGVGYRRIAGQLDRPVSTMRRWIPAAPAHAEWLREQAAGWIARVDRDVLVQLTRTSRSIF